MSGRVAVVHGDDRYDNVRRALELIEDELAERLVGKTRIVIKLNFVSAWKQLAATHADAVRAVLDVLTRHTKERITVAEGAALGLTWLGFWRYGYLRLARQYSFKLVNLNRDRKVPFTIPDPVLPLLEIKLAKTMVESDFRISVTPLKTHDFCTVTLGLKNNAVGSIPGLVGKRSIHRGYRAISQTVAHLASIVPPHLSVLDGFVGMESNGPIDGTPIEAKLAVAGLDPLAVDTAGAYLMGFDPKDIGHLYFCGQMGLGEGDLRKIEILGEPLDEHRLKFKPHADFEKQMEWKNQG